MRLNLSVIGALIGAGLLALPAPALAAAASGAAGNSLMAHVGSDAFVGENALLIQVQYRGHRRDGRRHDRHRGGDDGAGVAAGILGGVLLGAIIANEAQRNRSVDYCVRRYRSYDPRSGTYLGNDGYRHRCP